MSEINRDEHPFDPYQKTWLDGRYVNKKTYDKFEQAMYKDKSEEDIRYTKLETAINTTLRIVQILVIPIVMMVISQLISFLANK